MRKNEKIARGVINITDVFMAFMFSIPIIAIVYIDALKINTISADLDRLSPLIATIILSIMAAFQIKKTLEDDQIMIFTINISLLMLVSAIWYGIISLLNLGLTENSWLVSINTTTIFTTAMLFIVNWTRNEEEVMTPKPIDYFWTFLVTSIFVWAPIVVVDLWKTDVSYTGPKEFVAVFITAALFTILSHVVVEIVGFVHSKIAFNITTLMVFFVIWFIFIITGISTPDKAVWFIMTNTPSVGAILLLSALAYKLK